MNQLHGRTRILWHQPCGRDDEGAHADLNRAAIMLSKRGEGNGCVSPKTLRDAGVIE
jgi:hypothetical protein